MRKNEIIYYLALQAIEGIGPILARKLLNHYGSPEAIFRQKERDLIRLPGLGPKLVKNIRSQDIFKKAEREYRSAERAGIGIVTLFDKDYPKRLKRCLDAPLLLFFKGNFSLKNRHVLSIVGTRKMTSYGEEFLSRFLKELRPYDPIIISGLAYGVDVCAHRLALKNGISTVGILAHGMDRIYPRAHYETALAMNKKGGLMTEFWLGTVPERENFVKRNRIIAGLSDATVVVESSGKGGSLITAGLANSYHREVFAVPGRVSDQNSTGCNSLIKSNKAVLLSGAKDLEYMLNWQAVKREDKFKEEPKQSFSSILEKEVYERIRINGKQHIDQLASECNCPVSKISPILLQLELSERVIRLAGQYYKTNG